VSEIVFTESYIKKAKKFIRRHPELKKQYAKTLKVLEFNPDHKSLRLHRLSGKLSELYSVSINISYRICLFFIVKDDKIVLVDIGKHEDVY